MEKKVIVMSLGGSLIVPNEIDVIFLEKFKRILKKHEKNYRFVIVCGGGSIARKYIRALKQENKPELLQSNVGIAVTRLNARFMTYFFGKDANEGIPHDMKEVKNLLRKNNVVFCGALRYADKETSDSTAAKLAGFFKCDLINLTLVSGLYDKNPLVNKNAKFIPKISWLEFYRRANKMKFSPGQHFVLDQDASKIIMKHKIKTYILGKDLKQFDNFLDGKPFFGTTISQ